MPQVKSITEIHCAAAYFVFVSRDIKQIAEVFNVGDRTIRRWADEPEWQDALTACYYTGDRSFDVQPFRNTERDSADILAQAKALYTDARSQGLTHKKAVSAVVDELDLKRRRINTWAERFNWEDAHRRSE